MLIIILIISNSNSNNNNTYYYYCSNNNAHTPRKSLGAEPPRHGRSQQQRLHGCLKLPDGERLLRVFKVQGRLGV